MNSRNSTFTFQEYLDAAKRRHPDKFIAKAKPLTALNGCKVSPPPYVRTDEEFLAFVERTAS